MGRYFLQMVFRTSGFLVLFWMVGCSGGDGKKDIREFYFPLKQLKEGLVYEYRPVRADSLSPAYWYYRSFIGRDSIYLTGTYYEYDLMPLQFVREELVSNGMLLEDIYLYDIDSTGRSQRISVEVIAGDVFPFEVRDSGGIFLYKIRWADLSDPGATFTLIKNRRYAGDTTYTFQGKAYDCIVFEVRELFEHEQEGMLEQEYRGVEFYARDLGLIYYKKEITTDLVLEYALAARYPMEELERLFRQRNPEVVQ